MNKPLCEYGCGKEAGFQLKNGKWCCSDRHVRCPAIIEKNRISSTGKKHTNETKEKISMSITGKKYKKRSEEHKRNLSIANSGKKKTKEHIEKIRKANIGKRQSDETKENIRMSKIGDRNPNWKGGISYEPYCQVWTDKEYKESIKKRDGNKCLNPLCEHKSERLCLHHIDYMKKNCHPNNLITLCISCNSKANVDREWHENWYSCIINNRYKEDLQNNGPA